MTSDLLSRRQRAIDRHDSALNRWWPSKSEPAFRRDVMAVVGELEAILVESERAGLSAVERSRTARWLGDAYSDLSREQRVATGEDLAYLSKAVAAYQQAESLLQDVDVPLDEAKLNFNYANALRRFDREDVTLLGSAKERYLRAIELFRIHEPGLVPQVRQALESLSVLIHVAPLKRAVEAKRSDLERLDEAIKQGDAAEARQIFQRFLEDGGPRVLAQRVAELVADLPESVREKDPDGKLQAAVTHALLFAGSATGSAEAERNAEILHLLRKRLEREVDNSVVDSTRAATLRSAIDRLTSVVVDPGEDITALMGKTREIGQGAAGLISAMKELSYGLERPPEGARAARVLEHWWDVRQFLLTELTHSGRAEKERSVAFDLVKRSTEVDRRIVEAGADDAQVLKLEREAARPLAIEVRQYAGRHRPFFASPIWPSSARPTDPNAVFFSGRAEVFDLLLQICAARGLELLRLPSGANFADRRWEQLTRANVAVFDFNVSEGPEQAAVAYELGIAQSLGKSVVVLGAPGARLPFDIDVPPIPFSALDDVQPLEDALDGAVYWLSARGKGSSIAQTIREAQLRYASAEPGVYITQTLKQLEEQASEPDPIEVRHALETLVSFLGTGAPHLITPAWPGTYPRASERRLFHVMPFGPKWADPARRTVQAACEAHGCKYVRGDMVIEPQILRSIWDEICRASHVLVDITGFNANVAFELGISHTLGRNTMLVAQDSTVETLFPMIAKLRVAPYKANELEAELYSKVSTWLEEAA